MEGADVLFLCYHGFSLYTKQCKDAEGMAGKIFASSLHNYYMDAIAAAGLLERQAK